MALSMTHCILGHVLQVAGQLFSEDLLVSFIRGVPYVDFSSRVGVLLLCVGETLLFCRLVSFV